MKVYLAGFDVFKPDATSVFAGLQGAAQRLGLTALSPIGSEAGQHAGFPSDRAAAICAANIELLMSADAVIANLALFRGQEPDSGTVFEVGFAVARGLPVLAYGLPPGSYAERICTAVSCVRGPDNQLREAQSGMAVEDFGLPMNLMLACTTRIVATALDALEALAAGNGDPGLAAQPGPRRSDGPEE